MGRKKYQIHHSSHIDLTESICHDYVIKPERLDMDVTRIKIKLGEHEFEAAGPADMVQSQFAAFKELISSMPQATIQPPTLLPHQIAENEPVKPSLAHIQLEKVMHVSGRVVSLTALPPSTEEAALLIM